MNLLDPATIATVFAAIHDVTDTFCRDQIIVFRRARAASLFNDNQKANTTTTPTEVLGMDVPDKRTAQEAQEGTSDRTGGYVLINNADMVAAGLADAHGRFLINEATDEISINGGPRLRLEKVVPLGPLGGTMAVGKFLYSQELAKP